LVANIDGKEINQRGTGVRNQVVEAPGTEKEKKTTERELLLNLNEMQRVQKYLE
jgi:hypothetical protein